MALATMMQEQISPLALYGMNMAMPNPGNGTNKTGDTPQEVLMIVTDGVDDVTLYNGTSCSTTQQWGYSNYYGSFYRCQQPVNTALARRSRRADPHCGALHDLFPGYQQQLVQYNGRAFHFSGADQSSGLRLVRSLYAEVSTDGDITAALNQLFINAVQSAAHVIQ